MSGLLERAVRRWWAGEAGRAGAALSVLGAPLSWGYGAALAARNARYDAGAAVHVEGLVVASVGNLVAGGTGKTSVTAWIARELARQGHTTAVLCRGYRDEVALHRRWNPGVAVLADRDRVRGARAARSAGAEVALLDDGFQHRRLARDLDLVLLAAEDGLGGRLLPTGPFREPPAALGRAHAAVVTRRTASAATAQRLAREVRARHPGLAVAGLHLASAGWLALDGAAADAPRGALLAVCSVARPEAFAAGVRALTGASVELVNFPDHHEYSPADVRRLTRRAGKRAVVTTEKDAVKLQAHRALPGEVRVLRQEVRWDHGEDDVRRLLRDALAGANP